MERILQHNGVIERIMQTIKIFLYKVHNCKQFSENELHAILTDIETASNMRQLNITSENPEDSNIIPFTLWHLTIGVAIKLLQIAIYSHEQEEKKIPKDLKERWKERKQVSSHYWTLWGEEYFTKLRKLTKKYCAKREIKEGDVIPDLLERKNK